MGFKDVKIISACFHDEMPQPRTTALPRHQKKERLGTNKENTNAIFETTDAHKQNRNATYASPWNDQ